MTIISNVDGPETTSPVTTVTFVAAFVRMNFETLISNLSGARKPPLIIAAVIAALKRGERTDLSPRWGFAMFHFSHGLRSGLHSFAASRLRADTNRFFLISNRKLLLSNNLRRLDML